MMEAQMRGGSAEVSPGVRLHVLEGGEGPAVMLVHGFPQTSHEWREVAPALLAAGRRVVCPDYRGAGASSKPAGGYDKWTMAGDLRALARDHLGIEAPLTLVGHDLGAMVALAYAFRFREEVSRLVLMDAPLQGTEAMARMAGDPRGWHVAFHGARDIAERLVQGRERAYLQHMIAVRIFDAGAIGPEDFEAYVRAYEAPGAMRAAFEAYRAFDQDARDVRRALDEGGKLTVPVLALGGAEGGMGEAMAPMAAELAQTWRYAPIPRAAHWLPEENPQAVADHILAFADA
jgi:pimeloyl-ACP methyl ester carboxylesterase